MSVAVKERPILFSGPMVRAILDDRKTQTRRIVKPQPPSKDWLINVAYTGQDVGLWNDHGKWRMCGAVGVCREAMGHQWPKSHEWKCPYGQVGDRLWVRETWAPYSEFDPSDETGAFYRADWSPGYVDDALDDNQEPTWRPSIHMPRWASRITLEITGVRVERLNDISEQDAKAEGIESQPRGYGNGVDWKYYGWLEKLDQWSSSPILSYQSLWESINGKDSWAANPWVWCISFRRIES